MNHATPCVINYCAIVIGLGLLASCRTVAPRPDRDWPMLGGDATRAGVAVGPLPVPPLTVAWERRLGEALSASPVVVGESVYITSYDGRIYCLAAGDGEVVWSYPTEAWMESTPAVANGKVFAGSYDGWFYALDAATGTLLWRFQTGERRPGVSGWGKVQRGVDSSAATDTDTVYFGAWDGYVYALNQTDGAVRWRYDAGALIHWSSPALIDDAVVIGVADGRLLAIEQRSGVLRWERRLCDPHVEHMMCGPSAADGVVYTGAGWDGGFHAIDVRTGGERWRFTANGLVVGSPAVDDTTVYFRTANRAKEGRVYALDRGDGRLVWAAPVGGSSACSPVIAGDWLYVAASGAPDRLTLAALDRATGKLVWRFESAGAWGSPASAASRLFLGLDDGRLKAFSERPTSNSQHRTSK